MLGKGLIKGSLRNKVLLVLMLITLAPVTIFLALSYYNVSTQLHEDIQKRLEDNSRRIALAVQMMMNDRVVDVTALSDTEVIRTAFGTGGGQGATAFLEEYIKATKGFDLMAVVDRNGNCISSNLRQAVGTSFADQGWFTEAMAGKAQIGEFANHAVLKTLVPSTDGWSLAVAMPVAVGKEVHGVLVGYVRWDEVNTVIQAFPVEKSGYTYIVDRKDMSIIAHKDKGLFGMKVTDPKINLPVISEAFGANTHGLLIYTFLNPVTKVNAKTKELKNQKYS